jgi:hypothetical protein
MNRILSKGWVYNMAMNVEELGAEALKLDPESRAKLAHTLLVSLDELSEQENDHVWAIEAQRRDAELDADPSSGLSAE